MGTYGGLWCGDLHPEPRLDDFSVLLLRRCGFVAPGSAGVSALVFRELNLREKSNIRLLIGSSIQNLFNYSSHQGY